MSAEYEGKQDYGTDNTAKSIKVLPRPVVGTQHQIRALMMTGDTTGVFDVTYDDGMVLQGLDRFRMHQYEAIQQATIDRFAAIDEAWYD